MRAGQPGTQPLTTNPNPNFKPNLNLAKHSAANNTCIAAEEYNVLHCVETVDQQISKKHK